MRLNGTTKEFLSLVEAFQVPVYTLCSLLLGDGPAAEQAAQECFSQAYKQLPPFNQNGNMQTWLLREAYQQCRSWRTLSPGQINQACEGNPQVSTGKSATLQSLLARLEPEDRVVIALCYWYQLDLLDIAWVVGTEDEIVKSRLREAQKTLLAQVCQGALC